MALPMSGATAYRAASMKVPVSYSAIPDASAPSTAGPMPKPVTLRDSIPPPVTYSVPDTGAR